MNYYEHHLGDYAAATAHLSWDEDMAYSRLLRAYYHTERPLPSELRDVCRLVRAQGAGQRKAVEAVLNEFFTKAADGWHQKRCDEEIARYIDKREKAQRSADARWSAKRTHSDGNANASGSTDANALRPQCEGNAPSLQSPVSSPNLQTPVSREERSARATRLPGDWTLTPERRAIAEAERVDPERTFAKFTNHWKSASGAKARKVDWEATWRNWCMTENDRKPLNGGANHAATQPMRLRTADEIEAEERARGDYDAQH